MEKFFIILKKYYRNIYIRNGILILFMLFFNLLNNEIDPSQTRDNPLTLIAFLLIIYFLTFAHNHYFLRTLLAEKQYVRYFIGLGIYILIFCYLLMFGFPILYNDSKISLNLANSIVSIIVNTATVGIVYCLHFYFLDFLKIKEIINLKIQNDLIYLKQQLDPHFLLNALNNLYGVSLTNPEKVSQKIIELSDLLKYQILTCKQNYISFVEEKKFIEKYLVYSRWKLQNIAIISDEVGDFKNYKITPMLFLPLIENAIKYCQWDSKPTINIKWIFDVTQMEFQISNTFIENKTEVFSTNTGLQNLKDRLEILHPESKLEILKKITFTV